MRRSGFTMVELIFVIIIIGILSVAAIPKFGDIKDRAKVNSEYNALSNLDGAIEGAIAFQQEDYNNMDVLWHNQPASTAQNDATNGYSAINTNKKVLSKIVKKGDDLKIVGYVDTNTSGKIGGDQIEGDVIFIEGVASNHVTGVKKDPDVQNKPDRNDVWVFNTSSVDINVTDTDSAFAETEVLSGELKLLDASKAITIERLKVKRSDGVTTDFAETAVTAVN